MSLPKPHFSLNVSNLEASVAFYEKLFNTSPAKQRPGYAKFDLATPNLNLALVAKAPTGQNVNHFGIQVDSPESVLSERARFEALGLLDKVETSTVCCYAKQDKIWAADPDGNRWEVFVVLEDAEQMEASESGSCCTPTAASTCSVPEAKVSEPVATPLCGCSR